MDLRVGRPVASPRFSRPGLIGRDASSRLDHRSSGTLCGAAPCGATFGVPLAPYGRARLVVAGGRMSSGPPVRRLDGASREQALQSRRPPESDATERPRATGAAAVEHQQHPQRRRPPHPRAGRDLRADREAGSRWRRGGTRRLRGPREVADDRRARPAELQPLPRRLPRRRRQEHARRRHAHGLLRRLRRGAVRVRAAGRRRVRPAAEGRAGDGLGQLRHPLPAGLPDHGAGPGADAGDDRLHAQARCEGDPRLREGARAEAAEAGRRRRQDRSAEQEEPPSCKPSSTSSRPIPSSCCS